jgi:hypothetical protein
MLTDLAARSELFHTASGAAFADIMIDGHRETWPIRGARFRSWLKRCYYEVTAGSPAPRRSGRPLISWKPELSSMGRSAPFTYERQHMKAASTSILPTTAGAPLKSDPMGGGSSPLRR